MKGKTPEQVSNEIADKLRGNYLQAPMVTVSIAEYRKVYLLGEVKTGWICGSGFNGGKAIARLAVSQTALTVTIFKFDRPAAVSCWKMSPPTPPCRLEIPLLLA